MIVQQILTAKGQVRPTKRKIIKTVSGMEEFAKDMQSRLPKDLRGTAQIAAKELGKLKVKLVRG